MVTKPVNLSKGRSRYGDINIKHRDPLSRIQYALDRKAAHSSGQIESQWKVKELVERHPKESASAIRTWMLEEYELE